MGIKLLGAGKYLPEKTVDNYDFEKKVDTTNEWILKRTGIFKRHVSCGEYVTQMGFKAASEALKNAQIEAESLDLIICSTVTADFAFPSVSTILQGKLGATNAFAIDISCACSGFVYALDMANKYIKADNEIDRVLVVCCENMTKMVDYSDRSTCVLFGDGAGAVVVQKGENEVVSVLKTDGTKAGLIYANLRAPSNCFTNEAEIKAQNENFSADFFVNNKSGFTQMEGRKVYVVAVDCMVNVLNLVCKKAGLSISDLDVLVPHQANARIIDRVVKKVGVPAEKVFTNIENIGNISSACIPVGLAQLFEEKKLKSGDKVGLVSFGAGLIYGALIFTV